MLLQYECSRPRMRACVTKSKCYRNLQTPLKLVSIQVSVVQIPWQEFLMRLGKLFSLWDILIINMFLKSGRVMPLKAEDIYSFLRQLATINETVECLMSPSHCTAVVWIWFTSTLAAIQLCFLIHLATFSSAQCIASKDLVINSWGEGKRV
jgi:hypothetical protein